MTITIRRMNRATDSIHNPPETATVSFERLFEQHWSRICRIAARFTDDPGEAEDLALEAFWRLYRSAPQHIENPLAWLYRVVSNLGLNAMRARRRREHYETTAGRADWEQSLHQPQQQVEQNLRRAAVQHTLSQMKAREAQLLILRHTGLSYNELAAALNVSPASIGTLLARAERNFEQIYTRQQGEDAP